MHKISLSVDSRLIAVWISVFLVMLGTGIVSPVLPLYARTFEVSYTLVGFVVSAFGIARALFDIPTGSLTDRFGRRRLMIAGMAVFGIGGLIGGLAVSIYDLIAARFVQGLGASFLTTSAMTYVADIAPPEKRGTYVSMYQASFFTGTATGPAVGGLLNQVGGFKVPFFALAGLSAVATVYAFFSISETLKPTARVVAGIGELMEAMKHLLADRTALLVMFGTLVLFGTTTGVRLTVLPLYGESEAHLSSGQIGTVLTIAALAGVMVITWAGRLTDRYGSLPILTYGFSASALALIFFAFTGDFVGMAAVAALYGAVNGVMTPAPATVIVSVSNPNHRGLLVGLYRVFGDLGIILGPVLVGIVADGFGLKQCFYATAAASIAVAIIMASQRKADIRG